MWLFGSLWSQHKTLPTFHDLSPGVNLTLVSPCLVFEKAFVHAKVDTRAGYSPLFLVTGIHTTVCFFFWFACVMYGCGCVCTCLWGPEIDMYTSLSCCLWVLRTISLTEPGITS